MGACLGHSRKGERRALSTDSTDQAEAHRGGRLRKDSWGQCEAVVGLGLWVIAGPREQVIDCGEDSSEVWRAKGSS